jgi:hypothetical protein
LSGKLEKGWVHQQFFIAIRFRTTCVFCSFLRPRL